MYGGVLFLGVRAFSLLEAPLFTTDASRDECRAVRLSASAPCSLALYTAVPVVRSSEHIACSACLLRLGSVFARARVRAT